jgi:putative ABC transport system substrate-binding protein
VSCGGSAQVGFGYFLQTGYSGWQPPRACRRRRGGSNDGFFNNERERLIALAACYSFPTAYEFPEYSAAGGLMSYGPRLTDVYRDCGRYAGRILKGASPADPPVEQPTRFALVVNLKTVKALSISIPAAMLVRADEVIE